MAQLASHLAHTQTTLLPADLLKPVLTMLVSGTMEKNSMVKNIYFLTWITDNITIPAQVKSCSETALVDVLMMRKGPQGQSQALTLLDSGARDSLTDIISKSLSKLATQPEGKEMVLDDTLLL